MGITMLSLTALALGVGRPAADTIPPRELEFRSAHATLLVSFDALLRQAVGPAATRGDRGNLILFLRLELLPHAEAEEAVLYPALEKALLTHGYATATMVLDHRNVARLLDEMAGLAGAADPAAYTRRAYQLEALVRTHFAKEEEFVLPILRGRLSADELDAVFARMRALVPD